MSQPANFACMEAEKRWKSAYFEAFKAVSAGIFQTSAHVEIQHQRLIDHSPVVIVGKGGFGFLQVFQVFVFGRPPFAYGSP